MQKRCRKGTQFGPTVVVKILLIHVTFQLVESAHAFKKSTCLKPNDWSPLVLNTMKCVSFFATFALEESALIKLDCSEWRLMGTSNPWLKSASAPLQLEVH